MSKLFGKRPSSDFETSEVTKVSKEGGFRQVRQGDEMIKASVPEIVDYVSKTKDYQATQARVINADFHQRQKQILDQAAVRGFGASDVLNMNKYNEPLQTSINTQQLGKTEALARQKQDQLDAASLIHGITTQGTQGLAQVGRMTDQTQFARAGSKASVGAAIGNTIGSIAGAIYYKRNQADI